MAISRSLSLLCVLIQLGLAVSTGASVLGRGTTSSTEEYVVDAGYAKFRGNFTAPYSVAYLGVPYAEPPVGDKRFRAPVALDTSKPSSAVTDARSYPNFCIQSTIMSGDHDMGGAGTEDCLKVNVYTPANATKESKLPVLFYIHGGGYIYGNPAAFPFEHWINQSPNVVIVSVYYRLDSFGFLSHPSFATDPSLGDFNVGFQDQILALRWVKAHIAAFGGDPESVTINGESAGGGSVMLHLVANEGEKLFSGAIAQSVDREALPTPDNQVTLFDYYATLAGCGGHEDSIRSTLACLRNVSVSALAYAQDTALYSTNVTLYNKFRPVVDGKLIYDFPTKLLTEGRFAHVPTIVGSTSNETLSFGSDLKSSLHVLYPQLTDEDLDEFVKVYDPAQFSSETEWYRAATGEPFLRCGREIIGSAQVKFSRTWIYRYNQMNPTSPYYVPGIVGHADENWMMFRGVNTGTNGSMTFTGLNEVETAFSQELIAYWLSFVRTKDPNTYKLPRSPAWPEFSANERVVLQEDPNNSTTNTGIYVETEPEAEMKRCAFVATKYAHMQD